MSSPELDRLPLDSDSLDGGDRSRPVHLRPAYLVLVAVGGTVGTAAREALTLLLPTGNTFPATIFGINVIGAFLLGLLLDALARRGPDEGARRLVRLLLGTGFCGGFTTYSALAAAAAVLLASGAVGSAVLYVATSVVAGGAAAWAGIACGILTRNRR